MIVKNARITINETDDEVEYILKTKRSALFSIRETETLFNEIMRPHLKISTKLDLMAKMFSILEHAVGNDEKQP